MATSRALITNKSEFIRSGYSTYTPSFFWNMEDVTYTNTLQQLGTAPVDVTGIAIGKAKKFNGVGFYRVKNFVFGSTKHYFSFWYKSDPKDVDNAYGTWRTLLSTRSTSGLADRGIHLAIYNDASNKGDLNARIIGDSGQDTQYSVAQSAKRIVADTLYHIEVLYENAPASGYRLRVYVNGELWIYGSTNVSLANGVTRDLCIGDFTTGSTVAYPLYGSIDEILYFSGDNVPTDNARAGYRNNILNGAFLDYSTEPGSIQIPKRADNTYLAGTSISWESRVIDIGDPPIDYYGRLQMNASYIAGTHTIELYTRVSDDGVSFDSWQAVGADGTLYSPKKRYYQIRAVLITSSNASTPILKELEILEYEKPRQYDLISEPLRLYADLDTGLKSMGILNNAYDIEIEEEVKSKDILTFKLPLNDPKRKTLGADAVEYLLRIGSRRYVIKENGNKKDSSGKKISSFKAEAKWYELNDPKHIEYELIEAGVVEHITKILGESIPVSGWKLRLNLSTVTKKRTIRGSWKSVLQLLREVESTFGVELRFYYDLETDEDLIDILDQLGEDKKIRFYYNKNIKEIERTIDTYGMITRLYLYGAGELDITTVNNGLPYIENLEWVNKLKLRNKIRPDEYRDDRYTIPENLKADGELILAEASKPNINYAMTLQDLSARSGHESESINLGDTVYPVDEDLMIDFLPSRIMRRKYKVREPHKTEVELDQPKKELADAQSRSFDDSIQTLLETDPVSSSDIQEMTVFNHLLNSRVDDGLAEWTYQGTAGITASADGGFSGENSFKIVANYDEYKSVYQEVFNLSHRSTYTISAMVYKEGNITAGANGFVGIRVKVKYQDGSEEIKLLKIPDVTNMDYSE